MAWRNYVDAEEPRKIYRSSPQARVAGLEEGRHIWYVTFVVLYDIYVTHLVSDDSATQRYQWAGRKALSAAISSGKRPEAAPMEIGGRTFDFLYDQGLVDKEGIVRISYDACVMILDVSVILFSGVTQHQRLPLEFVSPGSRGRDGHRFLEG